MGLLKRYLRGGEAGETTTILAVWRDTVLAESDNTISVDGKRYFPPEDVNWQFLSSSEKETVCLWKGRAGYYDVDVDGQLKRDAAWVYPDPSPAAAELKDHVAFARGVKLRPVDNG